MISLQTNHPLAQATKPHTLERIRERAIAEFEEKGVTTSGTGLSLSFIVEYCERNKIPYLITAMPGTAYAIEKWEPKNPSMKDDPRAT